MLEFEVEHHCSPQFSPDGRFIRFFRRPQKWSLWDLRERCLIPLPRDEAEFGCFAPSAEVVLFGYDGSVHWWNPSTGRLRTPSSKRAYRTRTAAVSPDGRTLAAANPISHRIHLWSADTLDLQCELPGHAIGIAAPAFTPDGKTLASGGWDRTLRLWDVTTGEELLKFEGFAGGVFPVHFSPDGGTLATLFLGHPELRLWRATDDDAHTPREGLGVMPMP